MAFKIPIQEEFLQVTGVVAWTKSFEQMDDFYSWETGVRFTSFIAANTFLKLFQIFVIRVSEGTIVDCNFGCDLIDRSIYLARLLGPSKLHRI
jgi:hypothetical protein